MQILQIWHIIKVNSVLDKKTTGTSYFSKFFFPLLDDILLLLVLMINIHKNNFSQITFNWKKFQKEL